MKKRGREAVIEIGAELALGMSMAVAQISSMDDETLSVYIVQAELMLAEAKKEQARRLSEIFLPPGSESLA